jgi:uncharacterized protein
MKWSLQQLQKYRTKGLELQEDADLSSILERDPEILNVSPIHVTGRADIGSDAVTFHLHVSGHLILPCARTLKEVKFPIDIHTIETFVANDLLDPDEEAEDEIHQIEGDRVDLLPVIEELVLLEKPMQVFSEEDLEEELPSGKHWEMLTEEQARQQVELEEKKPDPRLADLAKFFNQDKS